MGFLSRFLYPEAHENGLKKTKNKRGKVTCHVFLSHVIKVRLFTGITPSTDSRRVHGLRGVILYVIPSQKCIEWGRGR
jgi:hypothetical protein